MERDYIPDRWGVFGVRIGLIGQLEHDSRYEVSESQSVNDALCLISYPYLRSNEGDEQRWALFDPNTDKRL